MCTVAVSRYSSRRKIVRRTILHVEFACRTIGSLAHPQVQILAFPCLEEKDIVAVVEFGEFVQLIQLRFCIELGIFAGMGKEGGKVVKEVSVSNSNMLALHPRSTAAI